MRMCGVHVCEQEEVRVLREEVAALKQQLLQQEQRLQRDASKEVCRAYRLFITCAAANLWSVSARAASKTALPSLHTFAPAECALQE